MGHVQASAYDFAATRVQRRSRESSAAAPLWIYGVGLPGADLDPVLDALLTGQDEVAEEAFADGFGASYGVEAMAFEDVSELTLERGGEG